MKKIYLIIFFIILTPLFLFSKNVCIQIAAYPVKKINSIYNDKKVCSYINKRDDCIVDLRKDGEYYGFCCGNLSNIKEIKSELKKIRKLFPSAFARKFNPSKSENAKIFLLALKHGKTKKTNEKKLLKKEKHGVVTNIKPKKYIKKEEQIINDFVSRNVG